MSAGDRAPEAVTETQAAGAPAGALDHAYLVVHREGRGTVSPLAHGVTLRLGRAPTSDIVLDDAKASREHCTIFRQDDGIFVRDLDSHNGTWLRGKRLPAWALVPISAGDVVSVGAIDVVVAVGTRALDHGAGADDEDRSLGLGEAIVADAATVAVYRLARRIAGAPTTVLLQGETGSGKEVLAEQLHRMSPRVDKPFLRINCAAMPETLLESELFGHERGAFTGADQRKPGLFLAADEGTILLDEIGELSAATQAKLLRVLETKQVTPLGSTAPVAVDVRIICATHRDLKAQVSTGRFREDLYYRMCTFVLTLPPLRERPAELALLAERFVETFAARQNTLAPRIAAEAAACLRAYRWPGNVRELRNAIEHAVVLCDGAVLEKRHLPGHLSQSPERAAGQLSPLGVRDELDNLERDRISAALATYGGSRTQASQALGISRRALIYKLHKYGLGLSAKLPRKSAKLLWIE